MVLIDSLYICSSGGLRLLYYLVETLVNKNIDFFLLADKRCEGQFNHIKNVKYLKASLYTRKEFYIKHRASFSSILCFGNIPAPTKLSVPVYTYFHNINLLTLSEASSVHSIVLSWLKREVFRLYRKNTDYWFVQTSNTEIELSKHLFEPVEKIKQMPFYDIPIELSALKNRIHGNDYVYISTYTGSKGHEELLEAWKILHKRGIDRILHLTVPFDSHPVVDEIEQVCNEGVLIENHGIVPFDQVICLYQQSKAIVYPSHNESLGLGIVEAINAGCDVISSDLPFTYSICKPSAIFNPYSPESIAEAIIKYESSINIQTQLLIGNRIDELIDTLVSR